jgi:hypothetical protein
MERKTRYTFIYGGIIMTSRENWPKLIGELNKIGPYLPNMNPLDGGSAIPIQNRQQARAMGLQNMGDVKTLTKQMEAVKAHQDNIVDQWFDTNIKRFLPAWYCDIAFTHLWMLRMIGIRMDWGDTTFQQEGKTYPATVATIMWLRWQIAGERLVWDLKEGE